MMTKPFAYLAFSGAIPFFVGCLLLCFSVDSIAYVGSVSKMMNTYGVAIVAFMAGSQWGLHFNLTDKWRLILPFGSNFITLVAWFSYLLCSDRAAMIVIAVCFLSLLIIDLKLMRIGIITSSYYRVRCWVSKIVILSLCVASICIA